MIRSRPALLLSTLPLLALLAAPASAELQDTPTKWPLPPIPPSAMVYPDLSYVTNGSPSQKLDLYVPKEGQNLPLIIFVHSGAFLTGDKRQWIRYQLGYLDHGYAIASINYRLSSEAVFPAQIEDCKAAVRWLRAHAAMYRLDPDHFAAWGASAGGDLAAMLGTTENIRDFDVGENLNFSSRVQAVVDFFGPTDLTRLLPASMGPGSAESRFLGCTIKDNLSKARRASPISYVTKNCPPFLIIHGDADPIVPYTQSVWLTVALKEAGVPVTFYTVKGAKHGGFHDPQVPLLTSDFFAKYLKSAKI
ncbi:MAG TPA: alpha/beta hydrolase [Candidatus Methylacidiphilales bacterium]|nr:alpha/beta hydrolase [Candidatus Methylacidiphilales bacterium]